MKGVQFRRILIASPSTIKRNRLSGIILLLALLLHSKGLSVQGENDALGNVVRWDKPVVVKPSQWWYHLQRHIGLDNFFSLGFSDIMHLFGIVLLTWNIACSSLLWHTWIIGILDMALVRTICSSFRWQHKPKESLRETNFRSKRLGFMFSLLPVFYCNLQFFLL